MSKLKPIIVLIIVILLVLILVFNKKDKKQEEKSTTTTTTTKEQNCKVNLTLVGDFLFEEPYYKAIDAGESKDLYFNKIKHYFSQDDISIGNMEVPISDGTLTTSGNGFNFCAPKYIGDLINTLDLQVLSTANNHTYDRELAGIKSTLNYFKNNTNIKTVGTNINGIDEDTILTINNIKIGFISYTYGTNIKPNNDNRKYINYYRDIDTKTVTNTQKELIKEKVNKLKPSVDVVIAIMHWGTEFTYTPNNEQKEMAKYLNSLGVDIIVGSHSHCIQPIDELISENGYKTLVYYSLGNFVSADDDISRTPKGQETFDNAYQIGLLSTLTITKNKDNINISNIKTEPIINYFDKNMRNFELVPFKDYNETYEKNHYRYSYGLTNSFIKEMYESVINQKYRQ